MFWLNDWIAVKSFGIYRKSYSEVKVKITNLGPAISARFSQMS